MLLDLNTCTFWIPVLIYKTDLFIFLNFKNREKTREIDF